MIKVFIPGPYSIPIWRQFPDSKRYVWKNCEFYFEEPKEYDYLVVWGLEKELSTLCPKEKRLCLDSILQTTIAISTNSSSFRNMNRV